MEGKRQENVLHLPTTETPKKSHWDGSISQSLGVYLSALFQDCSSSLSNVSSEDGQWACWRLQHTETRTPRRWIFGRNVTQAGTSYGVQTVPRETL